MVSDMILTIALMVCDSVYHLTMNIQRMFLKFNNNTSRSFQFCITVKTRKIEHIGQWKQSYSTKAH